MTLDTPTELTTAATNLPLALLCVACAHHLRRQGPDAARLRPWAVAWLLFAFAAAVAIPAHALVIPEALYAWVWAPINLALGLALAFFLVGVVHDVAPRRVSVLRPLLLGIGLTCFGVSALFPHTFLVFIAFQSVALLTATAVYGTLAVRSRLAGAGWITLGLVISIGAAIIQATGRLSFTFIWPFDHNGIFHLVQLPGFAAVAHGLVQPHRRAS